MTSNALPSPPRRPRFSSGPCEKRPDWSLWDLSGFPLGRSHRSLEGRARLKRVIDLSREVLQIPADYRIAIVPGSDTGAVEMALWSLLGPRGVDVFAWESFGRDWVMDVTRQLALSDMRVFDGGYGELPNLSQADSDRDIIFTWNGTTSGVRVPSADWLMTDRRGLTICDATSAAFCMPLPWQRLDVVTWSWQKGLGGEGAHGMLVLSPRAAKRLEAYDPPWPMPKLFRMKADGRIKEDLFEGSTINTPSMLAVEDAIDSLEWAQAIGGLPALLDRVEANFACVTEWLQDNPWCALLARRPETASPVSICLRLTDIDPAQGDRLARDVVDRLAVTGGAYDVGAYRGAPAGFRFWAGPTVETADLRAGLNCLTHAFSEARREAAV